ncbi:hypothetical protein Sango_1261600 [Sesamum angolense]|uniref:Uncharacterized protein n=1 Tax=Sesamum angolense TaxID=2727404 RepID=A0AAE1WR02_9LAMI|nr:hypothetical protein Sango_1261600 [Sesamum angolense]
MLLTADDGEEPLGDFNETLDQSKKLGGPQHPFWEIRNFRKALADSGLTHIGCSGTPYTWSNRHIFPNTVMEHLDRAYANLGWCLTALVLGGFKRHGCSPNKCEKIVADSWIMCSGHRRDMGLADHLEMCKQELKCWSRTALRIGKQRRDFLKGKLKRLLSGRITQESNEEIVKIR